MSSDPTTDVSARIDALIADATALARTGAAQRALSLASNASVLAQQAGDEAKRAGRNCVR